MDGKIPSVIIDDDPTSLQNLSTLLENHFPDIKVTGVANSINSGLDLIERNKPELVFLDVNFPEGTGFDLLKRVETIDFEVIFTTEHSSFALKAIEIAALYYIVKPVQIYDLEIALNRYSKQKDLESFKSKLQLYHNNLGNFPKRIILPTREISEITEIDSIMNCYSDGNYTTFYFEDGNKLMVCKHIGHYEEVLSLFGFVRVHNRYLVNLSFIKQYKPGRGGTLILNNGNIIPTSETGRAKIEEKLNETFLS